MFNYLSYDDYLGEGVIPSETEVRDRLTALLEKSMKEKLHISSDWEDFCPLAEYEPLNKRTKRVRRFHGKKEKSEDPSLMSKHQLRKEVLNSKSVRNLHANKFVNHKFCQANRCPGNGRRRKQGRHRRSCGMCHGWKLQSLRSNRRTIQRDARVLTKSEDARRTYCGYNPKTRRW